MKMNKLLTIAGLGLALTIGGGVMASQSDGSDATEFRHHHGERGGHRGMGQHFMQRMFAKLDLTEQQQEEVKGILHNFHQQMSAKKDEFGDFRAQMKTLVQTNSFDEVAVRALIESKQANRIDAGIAKAKMKNQIWNVLNAEQQTKLNELMGDMGKRGKHMLRVLTDDLGE